MFYRFIKIFIQIILFLCLLKHSENCYTHWKLQHEITGNELQGKCTGIKYASPYNPHDIKHHNKVEYRLRYVCINRRFEIPIYIDTRLEIYPTQIIRIYNYIVNEGTVHLLKNFSGYKYTYFMGTKVVACCFIQAINDFNYWSLRRNEELQRGYERITCAGNVPGQLDPNLSAALDKMMQNRSVSLFLHIDINTNILFFYIK